MAKSYQLISNTDGRILVPALRLANNPWTRFLGLMGRPGLAEDAGVWIEPCAQVHSCFMRFAFDAVFVSKTGEVLHTVANMAAWGLSPYVKGARVVVELPAGAIARLGITQGMMLRYQ
jgi:uncharacterized protein